MEARRGARRALHFFMHATLVPCWRRWVGFAEESRQQRGVMARAVGHFRNRATAGAFIRWVVYYEQVQMMKHSMQICVNAKLNAHWRRGAAAVEEGRHRRVLARRALAFFMNEALVGCWRRWVQFQEEAEDMRGALHRALGTFRHRALAGACRRWRDFIAECYEQRTAAARAFAFFAHGAKAAAFWRWIDFVGESQEHHGLEARALAFFARAEGGRAFQRWCQYVDDAAVARFNEAFMDAAKLSAAWNRWGAVVQVGSCQPLPATS